MKPSKKRITTDDYIKAIKKADREIEMENNPGFKTITKVHKSDKMYCRKNLKNKNYNEE